MIPIGFDPVSGTLVITDNGVFPAQSLIASITPLMPDHVQINDLAGRGVQSVAWAEITSLDGSHVPSSMAGALAYLQSEFAKHSTLPPGPRAPGIFTGPGSPDLAIGLTGDLYIDAISGDLFSKGN